jgi:hypothetical protein
MAKQPTVPSARSPRQPRHPHTEADATAPGQWNFSDLSPEELTQATLALFDELGRRSLKPVILNRLSNEGLKNLGFRIIEEFNRRYVASSEEDRRIWDAAFRQTVEHLFPELVQAFRQRAHTFRLVEMTLEALRRRIPKPRKTSRNMIIHQLRGADSTWSWPRIYKHMLAEHSELMLVKRTKQPIKIITMRKDYEAWLRRSQMISGNHPPG